MLDPDLEIGRGGGGVGLKKIFSALRASVSSKNKPGFATEISKWILGHLWLRWRGISLVDYDKEND